MGRDPKSGRGRANVPYSRQASALARRVEYRQQMNEADGDGGGGGVGSGGGDGDVSSCQQYRVHDAGN